MARRKSDVWEAGPHKPIRYGPFARFADWRAGRKDGRAGRPQLPGRPPQEREATLITPHLNGLTQDYQGRVRGEQLRALADIADVLARRRALRAEIADGEERSNELQKELDAMPETLDDSTLERRNAVEQNADILLIRARRAREHATARETKRAAKQAADVRLRAPRAELAQADGLVAVRRAALAIRVGRLLAHTLRRDATHLEALVSHHPDGALLLPYLKLSAPDLPHWLEHWPDGEEGPSI
jgi:hypothetical protein